MISFIVPAHNEERWLGACLASIQDSMKPLADAYEIIVVDDASTDATAKIAGDFNVRLLKVAHRRVSAVRNSGAEIAKGENFFFVDADTVVNSAAIEAGLALLRDGAVGGGCVFEFDVPIPWWARIVHRFGTMMGRWLRITGGCFLFCTRDAFADTGGFSEELYAGEDMAFVEALKRRGRFELAKPTVVTSARKLSVVGFGEVIALLLTMAVRGSHYETERTIDFMYGERAQECRGRAATL